MAKKQLIPADPPTAEPAGRHAYIPAGMGAHGVVLVVELELPPQALSPNARPHWVTKKKAKNAYKEHVAEACQTACAALGSEQVKAACFPWPVAVVGIQWRYPRISPDGDNCIASLKAGADGLTEIGVIEDDRHVLFLPPERVKDKQHPGVTLHLWRPEASRCPYCGNGIECNDE